MSGASFPVATGVSKRVSPPNTFSNLFLSHFFFFERETEPETTTTTTTTMMKKLLPSVFLAAFLSCVFVASPTGAFPAEPASSKSGAFPADSGVVVEFSVEELAFGDWMKIIEDKIDGGKKRRKETRKRT